MGGAGRVGDGDEYGVVGGGRGRGRGVCGCVGFFYSGDAGVMGRKKG